MEKLIIKKKEITTLLETAKDLLEMEKYRNLLILINLITRNVVLLHKQNLSNTKTKQNENTTL